MIRDMEHARQIQERRVKAGKRGYAKRVRKFIQRALRVNFDNYLDHENYKATLARFPANW